MGSGFVSIVMVAQCLLAVVSSMLWGQVLLQVANQEGLLWWSACANCQLAFVMPVGSYRQLHCYGASVCVGRGSVAILSSLQAENCLPPNKEVFESLKAVAELKPHMKKLMPFVQHVKVHNYVIHNVPLQLFALRE